MDSKAILCKPHRYKLYASLLKIENYMSLKARRTITHLLGVLKILQNLLLDCQ